jgi:hypothetical protein
MIRKLALKNNKLFESLLGNSLWRIIRSEISSKDDLEKLARALDLNINFDWIDNYDPNKEYGTKCHILNIDADHIGGTHWIAIYDDYYFDPLGFPLSRDDLFYLQYTYIPIQNYNEGGCGLYCMLFIWYATRGDIDGFYNLFD